MTDLAAVKPERGSDRNLERPGGELGSGSSNGNESRTKSDSSSGRIGQEIAGSRESGLGHSVVFGLEDEGERVTDRSRHLVRGVD